MTLDLDAFGAMVRTARQRRGLRAIDLAVAMRWAGTAPVYRYERGGPDAPRPDPDTINQLAQVLGLGQADRMTMLGLAGHLPDTPPLTVTDRERILAALGPGLGQPADPALVFDYRGSVLGVNEALLAVVAAMGEEAPSRWAEDGLTVFHLNWDPALGIAGRLVDVDASRRFQLRRFHLFNQQRRHEDWFREMPGRFPAWDGFGQLWDEVGAEVASDAMPVDVLAAVQAPMAIRLPNGAQRRYDISQRGIHGYAGLAAVLVMAPAGGSAGWP